MVYEHLHVGIDDTDSWDGGCTTHFAFELLREASRRFNVRLFDYPLLTRLNPNIPWKTRGNGSVCLRVKIRSEEISDFARFLELKLKSYVQDFYDCDPAIAVLRGRPSDDLRSFYEKALTRLVTLREALELARRHDVKVIAPRVGMGLIGSLAAIGSLMCGDHTYEVIAYRRPGAKRLVDEDSVWRMEFTTWPYTFNNVDPEKGRVLITPRGGDPVLYGIRGESPEAVLSASSIVKTYCEPLGFMVFRSNQGTDCHYLELRDAQDVQPYSSIMLRGEVASNPTVIRGGHVIFKVAFKGLEVWCAAYRPSGEVKRAAQKLVVGDVVEVYGGVRRFPGSDALSLNLEKMAVLRASSQVLEKNPRCPTCGKTLKSLGRKGGLKCTGCGFRTHLSYKIEVKLGRGEIEGIYLPPSRSMRHLAKPFRRYGLEKTGAYEFTEVDVRRVIAGER
ncbi:MAG: tRNA(Ile)(2)-agmatinylcytidine synthase [Candidatus Nezhaarchaeota archaeon]|nr:tRNA(Ile)(2)-agmatinylcytidine synthase [Candidatus Nezhaarchaeota archaeon]